ncbi:MAG: NUDIX domain-containing protein [Solirubrobacterales bacterium]
MRLTTLCYIEKDEKYLMLHRVVKENDINKDKWIGVGGHFEKGESPEECLFREVKEETGLTLTSFKFRGIITFISDRWVPEFMCLYTADSFEGEIIACCEGNLEWVPKDDLHKLNLWEGDKIFLKLLSEDAPFFSLKLQYEGDKLLGACLDGKDMELFDIRTSEGELTGKTSERSLVHRYGDLHGTTHVWVVRHNENGGFEVLLQKRSENKDAHPGFYDISSAGHIPAGEDFLNSAIRELEEELGISAKPEELNFIGMHTGHMAAEFYGKPFLNNELSAVYIYNKDVDIKTLTLQKEEVESVMWIDYEDCLEKMRNGTLKHCIFMEEFLMLKNAINNATVTEI